jgi:hypothetical protein
MLCRVVGRALFDVIHDHHPRSSMRSHWLTLCLALCASTASAQSPVAAPVGALRLAPATARARLIPRVAAVAVRPSAGRRAVIGAAVGAVVGSAVLAVMAAERVHRGEVIDHSEDGLVYVVYIGGGAVAGLLVGTLAGLAWPE